MEVVAEYVCALADCLDAGKRPVRPRLENQPVVVRHLADARVLNGVIDLAYGGEDGVDGDDADRHSSGGAGRDVAGAALDVELDGEPCLIAVKCRQIELWVHNLVIGSRLNG